MGEKVVKIQGYQHGREGGEDTGLPAWESGEKVGEDTGLPAWESGEKVVKIQGYQQVVKIQSYQHGREGGEDTGLPEWEITIIGEVLKILNYYHRRGVKNTELSQERC